MITHFLSTYRFTPTWGGFTFEAEWTWLLYVVGAGIFVYGLKKMLAKIKGSGK